MPLISSVTNLSTPPPLCHLPGNIITPSFAPTPFCTFNNLRSTFTLTICPNLCLFLQSQSGHNMLWTYCSFPSSSSLSPASLPALLFRVLTEVTTLLPSSNLSTCPLGSLSDSWLPSLPFVSSLHYVISPPSGSFTSNTSQGFFSFSKNLPLSHNPSASTTLFLSYHVPPNSSSSLPAPAISTSCALKSSLKFLQSSICTKYSTKAALNKVLPHCSNQGSLLSPHTLHLLCCLSHLLISLSCRNFMISVTQTSPTSLY